MSIGQFEASIRKVFCMDDNIQMSVEESGFGVKGHQVKPVIIELPDEQHKENDALIKRMIKQNNSNNMKFSGGYKNGSNASNLKKQLYRPHHEEPQLISNVYNELGVSRVQSKYRTAVDESKIVGQQGYSMQQLESKIELLKQDRSMRNNHLLQKADEYTLANNPSRFQNVIQAQSSLDTITIDNIEAKLEAHRRGLKSIEDQYNAKKGIQAPIDRYGYLRTNIDVDKEHAEIQVNTNQIYELIRKRENLEPHEIELQNLWELKKKNDPKLAEYDAKYQQYLVSKDAKSLLGNVVRSNLYTWDKYKQPGSHKARAPHPAILSPPKQHALSKEKGVVNVSITADQPELDGLTSIKDIGDVIAKKDDKFIAGYIFAQLDSGKVGLISKQELIQYILSQQHIINGYNIDTKWLFTDLDNFETKRKGLLSKTELAIFLATLEKVSHPKLTLTSSNLSVSLHPDAERKASSKKGVVSSFAKFRPLFQKLFNTLDFNDDKLIKRTEFIENIFIDSDCLKVLDQEVLRLTVIDKSITVRQIVGCVLDDYEKQRNEKLKKSKEFITFSRFCEYFEVPESLDLSRISQRESKKNESKSKELDLFDLPAQYIQLLKDIFNEIPRVYQDYVVSTDFVQAALRDPQILAVSDELCRIASVQTSLPIESLLTTLHRVQKQCDEYCTWDEMKSYFSRRGRPLDWDFNLIQHKKQLRNKKLKQQRASISKSKLNKTQNYFDYADQLKKKSKEKINRVPEKYTVPQPFDITDMKEKPNLEKAKRGQQQFEQLKKQFKANPVNKQILQPKPELIVGAVSRKKSVEKPAYNYENYQNDRIERALKRAQEQFEIEEKVKAIKQKTEIKAMEIGVDLTKKYIDVIKQQEKKKRENSKYKPTQPKVSDSLYPKDPKNQKIKKIDKIKQNTEKADEVAKRKSDMLEEEKKKIRQKNSEAKKIAQEMKKIEQQQKKKQDELANQGIDFKPKIKKLQLTNQEKEAIRKTKQQRQRKQKEQEELKLQIMEEERKKRLGYDKKSKFLEAKVLSNLTDEQILEKLDEINFQDLLLDEQDKQDYAKEYDNKNKTLRQLKDRQSGLAGRERAAMEQEEKRITDEKRRYKQKLQKQKSDPKQNFSRLSAKGDAAYKNDLDAHKSKALRRYRAIMEGKKPLSQYDKYSVKGDIPQSSTHNILEEGLDEDVSHVENVDDGDEGDEADGKQNEEEN